MLTVHPPIPPAPVPRLIAAPQGHAPSGRPPPCALYRVANWSWMAPSSVSSGNYSSNQVAYERDARIRWLLDMHPVTAAMLVEIGWFPSKNKALRRLNRLVRRRRIRLVGTVC